MSVVEILAQARMLTPDEEKRLEALMREQEATKESRPKRSLMELRGLGKGTWEGIDIDAYINEMRDAD